MMGNREIKYRCWDKVSQSMNEIYNINFADGSVDICPAKYDNIKYSVPFDNIILEQYTGLKDSQGKEIYEGDILDLDLKKYPDESSPYEIIFEDGCFRKNRKHWPDDLPKTIITEYELLILNDEIIGNIHETK